MTKLDKWNILLLRSNRFKKIARKIAISRDSRVIEIWKVTDLLEEKIHEMIYFHN